MISGMEEAFGPCLGKHDFFLIADSPQNFSTFFRPAGYLSGHLRLEQETRTHFFQRSQPAGPKAAVWNLKDLSGKHGIHRHIAWIEPTPGRILMSQETFRKAHWVCLPAPHKETPLLLKKTRQSRGWKPMGYYQYSLSPADLAFHSHMVGEKLRQGNFY